MSTGRIIGMFRAAAALVLVASLGCSDKAQNQTNTTTAVGKDGKLAKIDQPTRCDAKGKREVAVDLNQDSKPDVRKVYAEGPEGEVVVCREADLDFDGVKDLFVLFDELGRPLKDEVDLDHDGRIDIISTYANGKVVKQEIDTNSDGMVDRVRFLEADLPVRLEADTDGDQRIDYWEYYEDGKLVRIGMDKDGDGKADEWSRDDAAAAVAEAAAETPESTDEASGTDAEASEGAAKEPAAAEETSKKGKGKDKSK